MSAPQFKSRSPSGEMVKARREAAGLTQADAASLVYSRLRTWQAWEAVGNTHRDMPRGLWELFCLKVAHVEWRGEIERVSQ
jgi:hypothetical protein